MSELIPRLLDERWDDVLENAVRDAAAAVDAPVAFVSLLTARMQLFAAHVGLPAELEVSRATARDLSFCRFAVERRAPVVINSANDEPEARPELPDAFGFCSYVGVPLVVGEAVVGALCALDHRPRDFGADEIARLTALRPAVEARLAARAGAGDDRGDVEAVELQPYLRLLQAAQLGALSPEAMSRALRVLPAVVLKQATLPGPGGPAAEPRRRTPRAPR